MNTQTQLSLFDSPATAPQVLTPRFTTPNRVNHPATYSQELAPHFVELLAGSKRLLDPFAGIGLIFDLAPWLPGCEIHGVELEPAWAAAHPQTRTGNALALEYPAEYFDAICTSPTYGNRMADHHNAKDGSYRHTYTHNLRNYTGKEDHQLHIDNSGKMHWGKEYREFHEQAWAEAWRVLQPGGRFVLNVKDFVKAGEMQPVTAWHIETLTMLGFTLVEQREVETKGYRYGANRQRADYESVILLRKCGREAA